MTCAGLSESDKEERERKILALTSLAAAMDYQNGLSKRDLTHTSGTCNTNVPLSWLIKHSVPYNSMTDTPILSA